jgi:hypothetical protein
MGEEQQIGGQPKSDHQLLEEVLDCLRGHVNDPDGGGLVARVNRLDWRMERVEQMLQGISARPAGGIVISWKGLAVVAGSVVTAVGTAIGWLVDSLPWGK